MARRNGIDYRGVMKELMAALTMLAAAAIAAGQESQVLHSAQGRFGTVWANVTVTHQRVTEPYLPFVIAIQNHGAETVTIDRAAVRLIGPDGTRYPMADLKEVRQDYDKMRLDRRIATSAGIPAEVWYRQRRLRESKIGGRGGTVIDRVALRRNDALVDLVYFRRPRALALNTPFIIEVGPEGWEVPTRLGIRLAQ
jgi:hypothetical protein